MALTINHNLMAMNTARNLNTAYGGIATSTRRLSSGLRVGTAADDAAGLAIREMMRADIAATNQGVRNANDAISMIQTADGALQIVDEKLIRMKELAEQAATGTYTAEQRSIINSEFQQMAFEIQRISKATDFNGIKLLDGSLSGAHVGSSQNSSGELKVHFGSGNDCSEDYYYVNISGADLKSLFDPNNVTIGDVSADSINIYEPGRTEEQVNTYTASTQSNAVGTALDGGNYVVAWESQAQDGSSAGIYGQIISSTGTKVASEFQVNTTTSNAQTTPTITTMANGDFVVAWNSASQDGSGAGIYMQRFTASGLKVGTEQLVNTTTANNQYIPDITSLDDGGLFASWTSTGQDGSLDGVYGKIYNADGSVRSGEFQINTTTALDQRYPRASQLEDGNIAVTWFGQDGSNWGIFGQLVNPVGNLVESEFLINTRTQDLQNFQDVSALNSGGFVVVWSDVYGNLSTVAPSDVKGQMYNADGSRLGGEFTINDTKIPINPQQSIPRVTNLSEGGFAVAWRAPGDGNGQSSYTQMFADTGARIGSNNIVNISTAGDQVPTDIVSNPAGGFLILYQSDHSGDTNVYTRAFAPIIDIKTQDRAQGHLEKLNSAIVLKDKIRANLGATQNRLQSTITSLSIQAENLQAAESRISDVDVAQEMTTMITNQILAQSSTAMLAQANSLPKMALQLIQG